MESRLSLMIYRLSCTAASAILTCPREAYRKLAPAVWVVRHRNVSTVKASDPADDGQAKPNAFE